jgi:hypothetical protein
MSRDFPVSIQFSSGIEISTLVILFLKVVKYTSFKQEPFIDLKKYFSPVPFDYSDKLVPYVIDFTIR